MEISTAMKGEHDNLVARLYGATEEQLTEIAHLILLARVSCAEMLTGEAELSEENVQAILNNLNQVTTCRSTQEN